MNESEILISELRNKFSVRELLDGIEDSKTRLERRRQDEKERRFFPQMPEDLSPQSPRPVMRQNNNPTGSIVPYTLGFVVVLAAIVAAAVVISKYVSLTAGIMTGVVIIGALLAIGVLGALQLRNDDRLSEESFLKLMVEAYKRLPLLRGEQ
jgi:Flp pilus assembly protein TadB